MRIFSHLSFLLVLYGILLVVVFPTFGAEKYDYVIGNGDVLEIITWKEPDFSREEIYQLFREINNQAFEDFSVSPKRWEAVAEQMAVQMGVDREIFCQELPVLMEIYQTAPEFLEGAEEALAMFKLTGLPMGLVTHAGEARTRIKVDQRGLGVYFDRIKIVSEDKFKSPEDWLKAINDFGMAPENTLVLGDNLVGDIRAAHSVGVRHLVYFPGNWIVYNYGEIPAGVTCVSTGIKGLMEALLSEI